jgi:hypothetical protein
VFYFVHLTVFFVYLTVYFVHLTVYFVYLTVCFMTSMSVIPFMTPIWSAVFSCQYQTFRHIRVSSSSFSVLCVCFCARYLCLLYDFYTNLVGCATPCIERKLTALLLLIV